MSLRTVAVAIATACLLAVTMLAADINGTWTGKMPARETVDATFKFKVEGAKLTGTITAVAGEQPISDGKVDGANISFKVEGERPQSFTGVVAGDEIKMTRIGRNGTPREFVVKRQK